MRTTFTDDDEGKEVVNESGDEIGVVEAVEDGSAHVNPNPDLTDSISSKLGWGEADEETYRLDDGRVERITENQVVVRD